MFVKLGGSPGQTAQFATASDRAGSELAEGVRRVKDGDSGSFLWGCCNGFHKVQGDNEGQQNKQEPMVSHYSFKYSLRSLPTRKKGRRLGWTRTISPVLGLRPW